MSMEGGSRYDPLKDPNAFDEETKARYGLRWDQRSRQWLQRADVQSNMLAERSEPDRAATAPQQNMPMNPGLSPSGNEIKIGRRTVTEDYAFIQADGLSRIVAGALSGLATYQAQRLPQAAAPSTSPEGDTSPRLTYTQTFPQAAAPQSTEAPRYTDHDATEDSVEDAELVDELEDLDIEKGRADRKATKAERKAEKKAAKEAKKGTLAHRMGREAVASVLVLHAVYAGGVALLERPSEPMEYVLLTSDIQGNAANFYNNQVKPLVGAIETVKEWVK